MTQQNPIEQEAELHASWLEHPVTKKIRKELEEKYEEMKESWARGTFTSDATLEQTTIANIKAVTELQTTRRFLELIKEGK